jgi:hypothetical protein
MMSYSTRITIQPVPVDGIRPLSAQRGWFLGATAEESRIVRCSESVASEQDAWRVCSVLRQLGVVDQDYVNQEASPNLYLDLGVMSLFSPNRTECRAVFLKSQAIVRVLRMERDQLVQDCELPFVRMVIRAVHWCRFVRASLFGRTIMMSY